MTTDRPYLLFDNSVQWFGALARVVTGPTDSSYNTTVFRAIPSALWCAPFVDNLSQREATHQNLQVQGQGWTAWSLSEAEFGRISRLLDLQPAVTEHNRLSSLT